MDRSVITIIGHDAPGIIARSSTYLYENNVSILDISQSIISGIFNMMMIVDTTNMTISYDQLVAELRDLAASLGVDIRCQKEEIFDMMHRI